MKLNPLSSQPLVGLDIQPHEARLMQLRKTRKGFLAEQAALVNMPEGVFADGKIRNWDALRSALAESVQMLELTGMAAAINLPANLVRMQHLQIPSGLSDAAIEEEIKVQLERDFPGLSDSLYIDFSAAAPNDSGYSEVFFVVTRHEYVSQYICCINSTGLKVKIVDVDIYALKRVFNLTSSSNESGKVCALACYINRTASLSIFAAHEIIFQHQWDIDTENEFLPQLKSRIQIFLAAFPNKIIRSLAIYSNHPQMDNNIEEANSAWEFSSEFDIHYPNPFASLTISQYLERQINPEKLSDFLVACGSAMREVPRW